MASRTASRARIYSAADLERRWRPKDRRGEVCGYTLRGKTCTKTGAHYCEPRGDRVVFFFAEVLVHTKGLYAGRAFVLEDWQEFEIIRPLFGEVIWDAALRTYVRRYRVAWIVVGRKNGKSDLAAGVVLYLLVGDDEESAEVYGAAKDTKQAGKVGEVVESMRKRSALLNGDRGGRLKFNRNSRRTTDEQTNSYFEVITADALGELGHNPHGSYIDEVLSQADAGLYNALRTAMGTRHQPLMVMITTETNDPAGFGANEIDEAERTEEDPSRAPHVFTYIRKAPKNDEELERIHRLYVGDRDLPVSTDPWDERNWHWPNPALRSFKRIGSMREEATEARNDPTKENPFRQYQLNQRQQQVTRWMPLHLWDASAGLVVEEKLKGRRCFAGLDLASTTDLAAWVLLFPPLVDGDPFDVLWRFWTPEAQIPFLDKHTAGMASVWQREGKLLVTPGDWIDYEGSIHPQIARDRADFRIANVGYDQKEATATAQFMQGLGLAIEPVFQGYGLSGALKELMRLVKAEAFRHGGHPVARWNADSAEVRRDDQERIKLVKPDRNAAGKRVDGIAAAGNAIHVMQAAEAEEEPAVLQTYG